MMSTSPDAVSTIVYNPSDDMSIVKVHGTHDMSTSPDAVSTIVCHHSDDVSIIRVNRTDDMSTSPDAVSTIVYYPSYNMSIIRVHGTDDVYLSRCCVYYRLLSLRWCVYLSRCCVYAVPYHIRHIYIYSTLLYVHFPLSYTTIFRILYSKGESLPTCSYDRFHSKCYTPKIHQIQKLKFLGTNSHSIKISIWLCTARYREIWVSRFGGFWGFSNVSGNRQQDARPLLPPLQRHSQTF